MANVDSRIAGLRMANLIIAGNSQAYISVSTVTEQFTKSSSGYVEVDDCELQVSGNVLISGSGTITIIGNKINNLVVNNAGAAVLIKGADDCLMPQVTAGSLNIVDSIIRASSNTANAVTASAGTVVTLMNNQIVTPAADNVARVSIAGFHSIISLVYDKANSTLSNSLNSVVYFQTANVDSLVSSGNVTGGNILTGGRVSATGNITGGNLITTGSGGAITMTGGNITGVGNISAGNISATGNVTAANFFGNGNTLSNVATTFESTWTVPVGNSTQSFTVTASNTYSMWVDCNIPNGILAWNATATVTNTNVPVVGYQYAWVYDGGGTPIDFTSIPNQFIGTANTIVRNSTAPSSTTNRFDFGINNTSGNAVTIRYGWAQIS
jgi:hypothetical protein